MKEPEIITFGAYLTGHDIDTVIQMYNDWKGSEATNRIPEKECFYCNAKLKKHPHRLSKGLCNALIKLKAAIIEKRSNCIHLQSEVQLSKNEFCNFQALRYFGLVAKYIDPETKQRKEGYWLITKRGNAFTKNKISIHSHITTFRNKIDSRSEKLVKISDILNDENAAYWDRIESFIIPFDEEFEQMSMF